MPQLPQQKTIVQYLTNGTQTQFTFAFYAPTVNDIKVFSQPNVAPAIPAADILVLNVDYTVALNADPYTGGTITLAVAPFQNNYLTIVLDIEASLTTNFAAAQNFNGANLDAALYRLLLLCQQNKSYLESRALSYIINSYLPGTTFYNELPILGNQQIWQGTDTGIVAVTLEEGLDVSTLRSELSLATPNGDGASVIGYYNDINDTSTNVNEVLSMLANMNVIYLDEGVVQNSYVATVPNFTLARSSSINIQAARTNVGFGNSTLTINGVNNKIVIPNQAGNLPGGAIVAGYTYNFFFDGAIWQIRNPSQFVYACTNSNTADFGIPANTMALNKFDSVLNDPNTIYNTTTNQFLPTMTGWYNVQVSVQTNSVTNPCNASVLLYKNGVVVKQIAEAKTQGSNGTTLLSGHARVYLNGVSDYLTFDVMNYGVETLTVVAAGTYLDVVYLGNSF